jgi:hypothetical protein
MTERYPCLLQRRYLVSKRSVCPSSAVHGIVAQEIRGDVNISEESERLLQLIEQYARNLCVRRDWDLRFPQSTGPV